MKTRTIVLALVLLAGLLTCGLFLPAPPASTGQPTPPSPVGLPAGAAPVADHLVPLAPSDIAQVWANDGGDKGWRSELRATDDPNAVLNFAWDGTGISLFGARNEVVNFNLVLEVPTTSATNVSVSLISLSGPGRASITTVPASSDGVFNYVGRDIELFYVRYLEIKGLSVDLAYNDYDERHIPERCRRPYDENGVGTGAWEDRLCHNQLYPEIAVPLEFHTPFTIPAGTNQAIWGDIYIPKAMPAGNYLDIVRLTITRRFLANFLTGSPGKGGQETATNTENAPLFWVGLFAVGLFFGIYPANRAADLNPIEALRYE